MDLLGRVAETIDRERLLEQGETAVVAVSGGTDSIALLHLLDRMGKERGWKLIVAHINHQLRISESELEAASVRQFSERLGLIFEYGKLDVLGWMKRSGLNVQLAAREKRYEFLIRIAEKHRASKIVLGHHADDQTETVLMRLIRGSGLSGLSGIPIKRREKNVELVRPLLRIKKTELEAYCRSYELPVCEDSSNKEKKYFRNQVRLDIIPFLQSYNPKIGESINRLAEQFSSENDYLEGQTKALFDEIIVGSQGNFEFSRNSFLTRPIALQRRLIKLILSYLSSGTPSDADMRTADFQKIDAIRLAVAGQATPSLELHISEEITFVRDYDKVMLVKSLRSPQPAGEAYEYAIPEIPTSVTISEIGQTVVFEWKGADIPAMDTVAGKCVAEAYFDADQLHFPLTLRSRRKGDRIRTKGLNGHKKVKDMFIDAKISRLERERIPLLVDADQNVLWVPGLRRSELALTAQNSTRILSVRIFEREQHSIE